VRGRWNAAVGILAVTLGACAKQEQPQQAAAPAGPAKGTPEWKIENAMSAGPTAIASGATIMDWAAPGGQMTELRHGTNGWTCMPDVPDSPGNDPMCVDGQFLKWAGAWMSKAKPNITAFGSAYMLQGGSDASNTDPFKHKPDSGATWVDTGPHVMVVVPNVSALAGLSTDWKSGGPYIMWQGTPYAHVMIPVARRARAAASTM
jgi:hypothetical protein